MSLSLKRYINPPVWDAIYAATFAARFSDFRNKHTRLPTPHDYDQMASDAVDAADEGVEQFAVYVHTANDTNQLDLDFTKDEDDSEIGM